MNRRFVNLVTHSWAEGIYSLRRIDPYHLLFYPSAKAAIEEAKRNKSFPAMQTLELLQSSMNFTANPPGGRLDLFTLLSSRPTSEGGIVLANTIGEAKLYDADKQLLCTMGRLNEPKGLDPIGLSVMHPVTGQDSLYVMDRRPGRGSRRCFEILEFTPEFSVPSDLDPTWRWRLLPPPPFVQPHVYYGPSSITSYTTVLDSDGYSTIFISCESSTRHGTYSFETARRDSSHRLGWRPSEKWKHLGNWLLPFHGKAQYVPEFNLWFGFSASSPNNLCAADMSAMDKDERQPIVQHEWQDVNPPEGDVWFPTRLKLLNLGDGKFLSAKTIEAEETGEHFVVFTGVQIMRDAGDGKTLQMVKHRCTCYAFRNHTICLVL